MMCFYIPIALLVAHLAGITVSLKHSATPFFVFIAGLPHGTFVLRAAFPVRIGDAAKAAFKAVRDFASGFFRQDRPITRTVYSRSFFGEFAKVSTLPFWKRYSFIPASRFLPSFPLADAIIIKESGYTGLGRTKLTGDRINTESLLYVESLEGFLARHDRALGGAMLPSWYSVIFKPVVDGLRRLHVGRFCNFPSRHFACYVQILKCAFVKHFIPFNAIP